MVRRRPSRGPNVPALLNPLLGRDHEMMALQVALDGVERLCGGCLWVFGVIVNGKAHLLHHLRRQAVHRDVEWIELSNGESRPLHWLDWVCSIRLCACIPTRTACTNGRSSDDGW